MAFKPTWRQTVGDPSSYANIDEVVVKHMSLDWNIDFTVHEVRGSVELRMEVLSDTRKIVLDSRDLTIHDVTVDGTAALFTEGDDSDVFGTPITIFPPEPLTAGAIIYVKISYKTSPDCSALAWLPPAQTEGKTHPYLFSQCQAIHARSLVPCMDAPSVRATYDAKVSVPKELRALMSAILHTTEEVGDYCVSTFDQPVAIASNLLAIVVGNLERRDISHRVAIWSEPVVVDDAASDFSNTEKFVKACEELVGPYEWTRYDIVCLPGSFPLGGMENPCLTFASPTLLTGDKSLTDVICHEVAHSWTGNLVSPKTWEDFYMNEGFTMFLQRKVMAKLYGNEHFGFDAILGWDELQEYISSQGDDHAYTVMRPELDGVDPDDAYSVVPYEKGFIFVCYLESLVGDKAAFEKWLYKYIQTFRRQAITTDDMLGHYVTYFTTEGRNVDFSQADFRAWFDEPGLPPVPPNFRSKLIDDSLELTEKWRRIAEGSQEEVSPADIDGWMCLQICCFLNRIDFDLPVEALTLMDKHYKLNSSNNSEVLFLWLTLCIKNKWSGHEGVLRSFLKRVGRMRFTRPLYCELKEVDEAEAVAIFQENKDRYHNICSKMVAKDLGLDEEPEPVVEPEPEPEPEPEVEVKKVHKTHKRLSFKRDGEWWHDGGKPRSRSVKASDAAAAAAKLAQC
eukprot:TRINITY_DN752_c0_g1_i4.p1 TRINITY_DN752_c0_g1~~TRINITY_DN752_c0_g1_i4.p1  ORF type:complete len:678 (+),score=229.50 TRINITY_DN752_c0_g1_i4:68-2101(+)